MAYSPIVMDHFKNPRNVGEIIQTPTASAKSATRCAAT